MFQFFKHLFSTDFVPHGYCMRWSSDVLWLHVASDAIIALAYYVIPVALIYFVRKRKDLALHWMFVAFGIFILACGTTHVFGIVTLWYPMYRMEGIVKAITAVASIVTGILLVKIIPAALSLPSPDVLRREIDLRKSAERDLLSLNAGLEERVKERTIRLDRYNKALQSIAYISSHDLREPVRTIAIFTQLLEQRFVGKLDSRELELMTFIVGGSRRIESLIDDLSNYTRAIHSTDLTQGMPAQPVQAGTALRAAMDSLRAALEEAGAAVVCPNDLPTVAMDGMLLQLVFQNLLSNAVKYRRAPDPVQIEVRAVPEGDSDKFSVRDNGVGLDMAYAETIFQPFKRLSGDEIPGSGVGLAICRNIVESFGGRIWVESEGLGQGATFYFTIPKSVD